jgi:hypothetical protein
MTSWRDHASEQAQDDIQNLIDAVLPLAQQQLNRRGGFFPFGATVDVQGEVTIIAEYPAPSEQPDSKDLLQSLYGGLQEQASELRAAVFVSDVATAEGDAIRAEVEHREGPALVVLAPYSTRRLRRAKVYGELELQPGEPRLWAGRS